MKEQRIARIDVDDLRQTGGQLAMQQGEPGHAKHSDLDRVQYQHGEVHDPYRAAPALPAVRTLGRPAQMW